MYFQMYHHCALLVCVHGDEEEVCNVLEGRDVFHKITTIENHKRKLKPWKGTDSWRYWRGMEWGLRISASSAIIGTDCIWRLAMAVIRFVPAQDVHFSTRALI